MLCSRFTDAWAFIKKKLALRAIKNCSISSALDGTKDKMLREDISDKRDSEEGVTDDK